jgi:hypothetical protein
MEVEVPSRYISRGFWNYEVCPSPSTRWGVVRQDAELAAPQVYLMARHRHQRPQQDDHWPLCKYTLRSFQYSRQRKSSNKKISHLHVHKWVALGQWSVAKKTHLNQPECSPGAAVCRRGDQAPRLRDSQMNDTATTTSGSHLGHYPRVIGR